MNDELRSRYLKAITDLAAVMTDDYVDIMGEADHQGVFEHWGWNLDDIRDDLGHAVFAECQKRKEV